MTSTSYSAQYKVSNISDAGQGRVIVNFTQEIEGVQADGTVLTTPPAVYYGSPVSLNLSLEEAAGYFPGQTYTVTFKKS